MNKRIPLFSFQRNLFVSEKMKRRERRNARNHDQRHLERKILKEITVGRLTPQSSYIQPTSQKITAIRKLKQNYTDCKSYPKVQKGKGT